MDKFKKIIISNLFLIIFGIAIAILIYYTIKSSNQWLTQIIGGVVGGYIALIGVKWTLTEQNKQNNMAWERQKESEKEERRIMIQPMLFLNNTSFSSPRLFLNWGENKLFSELINSEDYSCSFDKFELINHGKDAARIIGIKIYILKPDKEKCIVLKENSIMIDMELINLYFNKEENFTISIIYSDVIGNLYSSNLNRQYQFYATGKMLDENKTEINTIFFRYKINEICDPVLIKKI